MLILLLPLDYPLNAIVSSANAAGAARRAANALRLLDRACDDLIRLAASSAISWLTHTDTGSEHAMHVRWRHQRWRCDCSQNGNYTPKHDGGPWHTAGAVIQPTGERTYQSSDLGLRGRHGVGHNLATHARTCLMLLYAYAAAWQYNNHFNESSSAEIISMAAMSAASAAASAAASRLAAATSTTVVGAFAATLISITQTTDHHEAPLQQNGWSDLGEEASHPT